MIVILEDEEIWFKQESQVIKRVFKDEQILWIKDEHQLDKLTDIRVLILDMELGDGNGIDIGRKYYVNHPDTVIIIVTNYDDYMRKGYEIRAYRYISKNNLSELEDALLTLCNEDKSENILVHIIGKGDAVIDLNDIKYIETYGRNIKIHWKTEELLCSGKIKDFENLLSDDFVKMHRSIIINMNAIEIIEKRNVVLKNGETLLIPVDRRKDVMKKWMDWKFKK